jgi:hypothetical protein
MAARENQGLQIALIVFVMLTIMLSVTTFLFFRNYQNEQQKAKAEGDRAADVTQKMSVLESERSAYVKYIGFPETEKKETIDAAYEKDFANSVVLGLAALPDNEKNYRKLIENYEALTKSLHVQLAKKDEDLRLAKATFEKKQTEFDAEKTKLTKDKDETIASYMKEREAITAQIKVLTETKNKLIAEKEEKDKALEDLKGQTDSQINKLNETIGKQETSIQQLKIVNNEVTGEYNANAAPDGRVVWVNSREGTALINLGSADNLRKRITFSVYDPDTTDVSALQSVQADKSDRTKVKTPASAAVTKGSIEVINITDRHLAECRILQHSPSNPIIPGDVIFTPVWQPGQQDHFALVGKLDIDGDDEDDARRVQELILINGGAIDTEINVQTRYLVVGKVEEGSSKLDENNKLLNDAKKFGIQHIKLSQFMEMMGYSTKAAEGVIKPGEGMTYPRPGEPTAKFRPRNPPPRGKQGTSAFGE